MENEKLIQQLQYLVVELQLKIKVLEKQLQEANETIVTVYIPRKDNNEME